MGGINLLDQLKAKKSSGLTNSSPTPSSPKLNFSAGSGDSLNLVLRVFGLVLIAACVHVALDHLQTEDLNTIQAELGELETGLAQENRKKGQLRNIGEEMRGYQTRMDELQGKLKAVSQQETDRSYLIRALEYAAVEMPKEMWFNEISATTSSNTSGQSQSASATFKGYAINAQAVSDFIQKLEASVYFPSTTLDRLELVPGNELASPSPGAINVPPNSRKFQIMAKLGE